MQINNPRREFTEREYIEAAFFLQIPMTKLRALHIAPVSNVEFRHITCEAHTSINIKYFNNVFYYTNIPDPIDLLCVAFLIKEKQSFQVSPMLDALVRWKGANEAISEIYRRYREDLLDSLARYQDIKTFPFSTFNIKAINRIMAKHHGSAELDNDDLKLTFNKIKCGNEIEGYVNYKSITVFLALTELGSRGLNSHRVIYTFNKFSLDTADRIRGIGTLHPHIDGNDASFCFGNRADDWRLYARSNNFPFMIDLIYESLMTFNPESPYVHIVTIINIVKVLNVVYKDYRKMNPLSSPVELASHIFAGVNTCEKCGTILGVDGHCFASRCRANPNAEIACDSCGVNMERGDWDNGNGQYTWICGNKSCSYSPDFVCPIPPLIEERLVCRICGQPLTESGGQYLGGSFHHPFFDGDPSLRFFICNNNQHGHNSIWQFAQNIDTGEILDMFDIHYHNEFVEEIENRGRNH